MTPISTSETQSAAVAGNAMSESGVLCPRCQRRSLDEDFCDHCQFELPQQKNGVPLTVAASNSGWSIESLAVNWPEDPYPHFTTSFDQTFSRIRAIRPELWGDLEDSVRQRQKQILRALPPIHVLPMHGGALVVAEAWATSAGSDLPASRTMDELLVSTLQWAQAAAAAMSELHASGNLWLEFDPEAVEILDGQLRITNMDWRLFPIGQSPSHAARISPMYSPLEVCQFRDELIGPRTDVFHLAMAVYYRLAGLAPGGFSGRGLESFGFDVPPLRTFANTLPTGIWPVLSRALSVNAANRPGTVDEFVNELQAAIERVTVPAVTQESPERVGSASSKWPVLRWFGGDPTSGPAQDNAPKGKADVGFQTIAGRAKSAVGAVNQDSVVVQKISVQDRKALLMIVADGVTHARVGTGERASSLACQIMTDFVVEQTSQCQPDKDVDWPNLLDRACQAASAAIARDALSTPGRPADVQDNDLMSTTALIGVLDGNCLIVANVGDSRAYLVKSGVAEQLTVDGDVASSQLADGVPPEQVLELGVHGKALRSCLGACRNAENQELVVDLERARPQIVQFTVEPQDVFVLCSDGLVEEKVFLEPTDLVRVISANQQLSSQDLAEKLVAEADQRQRLPSNAEPNGYGDNITCVVLKIE